MRMRHISSSQPFILIVDDCDCLSVPLEIALRCLDGFRVLRAFDVTGACEILSEHPASIAALVTDLNMPVSSGYDLIRLMRNCYRHRHVPIVAMSGDDRSAVAAKALLSGANVFFAKPFSLSDMRSTLRKLIF